MIRKSPLSAGELKATAKSSLLGLTFNACAFALPLIVTSLLVDVSAPDIIDYAPTAANRAATARAVDAEAERFVTGSSDRRAAWNALVQRELDEGDAAAARGFVLTAPSMLSGRDKARISGALAPGADENDYLLTAADLLDPITRQRFRFAGRTGVERGFDVLGEAPELARQAVRWRDGEPIDVFLFALGGATLINAGPDPSADDARLGASVIKIARSSARLPQALTRYLEARVEAAAPAATLRRQIEDTFKAQTAIVDEGQAATLAFSRALDRDGYRALAADLVEIGAMARATSPAGAVQLLRDADGPEDLRKLRLIAEAGKERAVAVSKRSPERLILRAAHGSIHWTTRLVGDLFALATAVLGMLACTALALNPYRNAAPAPKPAPLARPMTKADAVRRSRSTPPVEEAA